MIIIKKDLDADFKPVVVGEEYLNYHRLSEKLAYLLCLGYEVTIEVFDRFGNGRILFGKKGECTSVVDFKEINTFDTVAIEYNKLGELKRLY